MGLPARIGQNALSLPGSAPKDIEAIYRAIRPRLKLSSGPAAPGTPGPPGPKGVVWRGAWDDDAEYTEGDIVYHDNNNGVRFTYFCIASHASTPTTPPVPGGTATWHEIAEAYIVTDGSRPYVIGPIHTPTEATAWWNDTAGLKRLVLDVIDGQELVWGSVYLRVRNATGSTILAGRAVRITGVGPDPTLPSIELADAADAFLGEHTVCGVTMMDILDGADGWVCRLGLVRGPDFSAFGSIGVLYTGDALDGVMKRSIPGRPCEYITKMGFLLDNANPGTMWVDPVPVPRLKDLSDTGMTLFGGSNYFDVPMWLPGEPNGGPFGSCDGFMDLPPTIAPFVSFAGADTVLQKHGIIEIDCAAGEQVQVLPNPVWFSGRWIIIKKSDNTRNRLRIQGFSGGNIEFETEQILNMPGETVQVYSTGSQWRCA